MFRRAEIERSSRGFATTAAFKSFFRAFPFI